MRSERDVDRAMNPDVPTYSTPGVVKREKGGRGRAVVWAIYGYDGKSFVEQVDDNYDRYYNLIGDKIDNKMKKSDLSKESLEYNEFVKEFWN